MNKSEIRSALDLSPLLRRCDIDTSGVMAEMYDKGQVVRDNINGVEVIGLVKSGSVDVYSTAYDGNRVRLSALYPGDCFGIANLFDTYLLETTLHCRTQSEILFISKEEIHRAICENAEANMAYIRLCNQKIHFLLRRIELLTMQSSRGKLIEHLLTVSDETGMIEMTRSRDDLADLLGISRAALFREISFLQKKHFIRTEGSAIYILDRKAMEQALT